MVLVAGSDVELDTSKGGDGENLMNRFSDNLNKKRGRIQENILGFRWGTVRWCRECRRTWLLVVRRESKMGLKILIP